jgi:hypothetical protein
MGPLTKYCFALPTVSSPLVFDWLFADCVPYATPEGVVIPYCAYRPPPHIVVPLPLKYDSAVSASWPWHPAQSGEQVQPQEQQEQQRQPQQQPQQLQQQQAPLEQKEIKKEVRPFFRPRLWLMRCV